MNGYFRPWPIQLAENLDGSVGFSLVLLPAGHRPGLYMMKRMFTKIVAPATGSIVISSTWKDPKGDLQALVSPSLGLTIAGPLGLASNIPARSSGDAPLTLGGVFSGVTSGVEPPNMEAIGWVEFVAEI